MVIVFFILQVTTALTVGQTEEEWKKSPLTALNGIAFVLDKVLFFSSFISFFSFSYLLFL